MDDLYVKIGIAVAALVIGNLVARWWDRARPLVVLTRFTTALKLSDKAVCSKEIRDATEDSMSTKSLSEGDHEYRDLEAAYQVSERELTLNDQIDDWIAEAKKQLTSAADTKGLVEGVRAMLRWTGMRELIEILYYRNLITTSPPPPYTTPAHLTVVPSTKNDGCLYVVLGESMARLGGNFKEDKWREQAIVPLVEAIKHLDRDYLVSVLDELPAHAARERDTHRRIKDLIQPLRDDNTIWIGHCTVVNYGSSPFVVWPHAKLIFREKGKRDRIPVPCHVAKQKDDDADDAADLKGPLVIEPGKTVQLWVVTSEKKAKLQNGNIINALFKDETAMGRARLLLMQRGVAFKYSCRSTPLRFAAT